MTESAKTLTFVAVAVLSLGAAFISRPGIEDFDAQSAVGEKLNQFDVEDAKRLRIVSFDQETASTREFEVAEQNGVWVIPSKHGYPADAVRQMGAAATCLIDREVLRVAAETASQHAELGLVDPTSSKLDTNAAGVGIRVTMTNIDGQPLTDMIIGKKVPDTDDQYYVRNADQDVAYVVQLEPKNLTTKFDDWIEKDLLGLNPLDIRRLHIKDYTAELMVTMQGLGVKWDRRSELELRYDEDEGKWSAERLQAYDSGKKEMVEFTLAEGEELDDEALRELRYGLDDLSIVDVERKPAGLSADLKAGSGLMKDFESLSSLVQRGFAPMEGSGADQLDILSTEGEIVCTLQDGVEYVLRFGNLQMDGDAPGDDAKAAEADPNSADDDGIHRYLFVMARFNENELKQPKLQELPALPEGAKQDEQEETEEAETAESKPEESAEAEEKADESADTDENAAAADEKDKDAEKDDADQKDDDLETLIAERKRIEDENQRLLQEYQDKRKAAEERVKELNERFGDWYYVIDNKVFKQIHLGRDDVIKTKEKTEEKAEGDTASPAADLPGVPNLPGNQ